ncbi:hypothetical protein NLI96_g12993 [Meripilus lineatus]|uniref:Uncharacterized protein n=1 Tax=Meripilus lineatus TaxID=2056292 RepID=A0AAD5USS0_9APHY|nr:hypothetical protein NLI96_g12993 [Physisporinus lineatus]
MSEKAKNQPAPAAQKSAKKSCAVVLSEVSSTQMTPPPGSPTIALKDNIAAIESSVKTTNRAGTTPTNPSPAMISPQVTTPAMVSPSVTTPVIQKEHLLAAVQAVMDEENQKLSSEIAELRGKLKELKVAALAVVSLSSAQIETHMQGVISGMEERVALIMAGFQMQVDEKLLSVHPAPSASREILSDAAPGGGTQPSLASAVTTGDPNMRNLQAGIDHIMLEPIPPLPILQNNPENNQDTEKVTGDDNVMLEDGEIREDAGGSLEAV